MGTTRTPKYAIKYEGAVVLGRGRVSLSSHGWDCQTNGRPTDENLRRYVEGFEASTLSGGTNEHLGITRVARATVVLNDGSETVVARYAPAAFEVVR